MEEPYKKLSEFLSPELIIKAQEIINKNSKYCNMKKQYEKAVSQRNYVAQMQLNAAMDKVMRDVIDKLIEKDVEERSAIEKLIELLPAEERGKYRDAVSVLCFCFDAIDYAISEANKILKRNNTGFNVDSIPEVAACKKKVFSVINAELHKMDKTQQDLYAEEADNIYAYLLKRGGVFRRKVDKLSAKEKKDA